MDTSLRKQIYFLLILISSGIMLGRIIATDNVADRSVQTYRLQQIPKQLAEKKKDLQKKGIAPEEIDRRLQKLAVSLIQDAQKARPTLSANDRSRWLTIRALVEPDSRVYRFLPVVENNSVKTPVPTVDLRRNCGCNCVQQFNRANLKAKKYERQLVPYAIDKAMETSGWDTIDMVKHGLPDEEYNPEDPFSGYLYSSKPPLLPTLMAVPYGILYHTTGISLKEDPWWAVRILLIVLNLIPLIISWILFSQMIDDLGKTDWGRIFAMSVICFGTFVSSFATTLNNHLPAVVCITFAVYGVYQILYHGRKNVFWFLFTGFFGAFSVVCELPALAVAGAICLILIVRFPAKTIAIAIPAGLLVAAAFFAANYIAHGTFKPAYAMKRDHIKIAKVDPSHSGAVSSFDQNDWYIYNYFPSGRIREAKNARLSYWANRVGIDRGEPNPYVYFFHATIGHHGLFSLTPVWIFSMIGLFMIAFGPYDRPVRIFGWSSIGLTLLFFVFYLTRDQGDRNYGGMCCGLRWFFPLIPLWIFSMLPFLDRIASSRLMRGIALILLILSIMSVSYPLWNPWSHPWLYHFMIDRQWISGF
ncbi:MAG: hypothetical protein Q4G69_02665 [Planctomycetia bacterium]|nr:hypothetical protein [Planctomycetia bacterium]